jgi:hypothetical protein
MGCYLTPRKSQVTLISNSAVDMVLPSLFLGTEEIPWCDAITELGVVIDSRFRFDCQATKVLIEGLCHTAQTAFA